MFVGCFEPLAPRGGTASWVIPSRARQHIEAAGGPRAATWPSAPRRCNDETPAGGSLGDCWAARVRCDARGCSRRSWALLKRSSSPGREPGGQLSGAAALRTVPARYYGVAWECHFERVTERPRLMGKSGPSVSMRSGPALPPRMSGHGSSHLVGPALHDLEGPVCVEPAHCVPAIRGRAFL